MGSIGKSTGWLSGLHSMLTVTRYSQMPEQAAGAGIAVTTPSGKKPPMVSPPR